MISTDTLYVEGVALDMTPNTRITFTYKSPLLTDITKQSANYSQTITIPRSLHNEQVLGLPLSINAYGGGEVFRYKRREARVERDGIIIAEGEAYLLDSNSTSISLCLIFGLNKSLQKLKDAEQDINTLGQIATSTPRAWRESADVPPMDKTRFTFVKYNTGARVNEISAANVGYYGCLTIWRIIKAISVTYGSPSLSEAAEKRINNVVLMAKSANDSDYTAGLTPATLTHDNSVKVTQIYGFPVGDAEWQDVVYLIPGFSGYTANEKYGTLASKAIGGYTTVVYTASADQTLTISMGTLNFTLTSKQAISLGGTYVNIIVLGESGELRSVRGPVADSYTRTYDSAAQVYNSQLIFKGDVEVKLSKGDSVQFRVVLPIMFKGEIPSSVAIMGGTSYKMIYKSSGLGDLIKIGDPYHPAGNMPEISVSEFIKNICLAFGLFAAPTSDGKVVLYTLDEVLNDLGSAIDWTDKVVLSEGGREVATNHIFSLADYKARRNIIKMKEDSNYSDVNKLSKAEKEFSIICENEALDAEKVLATLIFAPTYKNYLNHYEWKNDAEGNGEMTATELSPRLMKVYSGSAGLEVASTGVRAYELQAYYNSLQKVVQQPHAIKVRVKLNTWELKNLDLTRIVYLAQYGTYFLIEQLQTTSSDIAEATLVKIA